jgi:hypothetical protein
MDLAPGTERTPASPLARLQRFARPRATAAERCELCGATIPADHPHLLELDARRLACACDACAVLFSGQDHQRYRRVPRRVTSVPGLEPSDALWSSLNLPINLAFFYHDSRAGRVVAIYPSPAGGTESSLPVDAWEAWAAGCPAVRDMQTDVEAVLINHVGRRRDCFVVPIDECYRLVGLIRSKWRGLSGGRDVWQAIADFFDALHRRAAPEGGKGGAHA